VDNSPPQSLIVVVVGVVEVKDPPQSSSRGMGAQRPYLHSLVSSRDNLVRHVVVLIFGGIVHRKMVDKLWLTDLSQHMFSVITVVGSAILMSVVLTFT
jgi:hypothetical protein